MDLPFTTLDVFTTKQLEGNPLAIVGVPPSLRDRLTQSMKQKIAQEFNLSETVFFHDDTSKSGSEAREVDIFTIERELPFAGHPTIGTAVFVRHHLGGAGKEVRTLITKAGPIGIEEVPASSGSSSGSSPTAAGAAAAAGVRAEIPHNVHLHAKTLRDVLPATAAGDAAAAAGLHPNAAIRAAELDAPLFSIVRGMTFALVPLPSLELLAEVRVLRLDFEGLAAELLDDGWREGLAARYYYVDVAAAGGQEAEEGTRSLRTRMVELGFEDPATGSAATALASYLTLTQERRDTKFRVTQGVEMGRKSDISVETTVKGGEGDVALDKVYLGGTAVVVMQGTLRVGY